MKCIVHGCANHHGEGVFYGDLCGPCYRMLTTGDLGLSRGQTFIHTMRDNLYMAEVELKFLKSAKDNKSFKRGDTTFAFCPTSNCPCYDMMNDLIDDLDKRLADAYAEIGCLKALQKA